jgi:hypothetical protein
MATTYLTQWSRGPQQATPEYGIVAGVGYQRRYRETTTITWRVYVTADSDLPASPVNPGNLSPVGWQPVTGGVSRVDSWVCIDRGIPGEYGNPAPRQYYETWQKVGAWQTETDNQPNQGS